MDVLLSLVFLLLGIIIGWFLSFYKYKHQQDLISIERVKNDYVPQALYNGTQKQIDYYKTYLETKEKELRAVSNALAAKEQAVHHLETQLKHQKSDFQQTQIYFQKEFKRIASELLEEKSKHFSEQHRFELGQVLEPLKSSLKDFGVKLEKTHWEDSKDRISLKTEIRQLKDLNLQLSSDANNLVKALKGDNKTQGDWGELRLELLLEKAGLNKDIHYKTQASFKDQLGNVRRPDFIINLPDNKHLIIDSKVSLKAYEAYFSEEDETRKQQHLQKHISSLKTHIKELSNKHYQNLKELYSPDYVLLFVPIEPALIIALKEDQQLFLDALDNNIVLVTSSTLLATMRTVSYIWKQEKQKKNVLEIARQSGLLYDKLEGFVRDMQKIGDSLRILDKHYDAAMNKLSSGRGNVLSRAEKIRELGAKNSKTLPQELLEKEND